MLHTSSMDTDPGMKKSDVDICSSHISSTDRDPGGISSHEGYLWLSIDDELGTLSLDIVCSSNVSSADAYSGTIASEEGCS